MSPRVDTPHDESSGVDGALNWLAMQYVLDELSDADRVAFELRLADDLVACEAVAEASRMNLTLHAALAESTSSDSGGKNDRVNRVVAPTPRRSWLAVGTAMISVACLFMAIAYWPHESADPGVSQAEPSGQSAGDRSGVNRSAGIRSAVELVSMWRDGMQVAESNLEDAEADLHEPVSDVAVPDWLLAAVSLEKNGVVEGPPEEWQDN
jgi:anti-sigma factor RsiW